MIEDAQTRWDGTMMSGAKGIKVGNGMRCSG